MPERGRRYADWTIGHIRYVQSACSTRIAAAEALVAAARKKGLAADRLLPTMGDWTTAARIAGAVGKAAVAKGLARNPVSRDELEKLAIGAIGASRACVE